MTIEAGSLWREKARLGHVVRVEESSESSVAIRHIRAHNIRTQTSLSELKTKNFLRRYESTDIESLRENNTDYSDSP